MEKSFNELSRRDALKFLAGLGASVAMASVGVAALATGDGGGGGGTEGGGGGGVAGSARFAFVWFDKGGFYDNADYQSAQGWDRQSAKVLLDKLSAYIGKSVSPYVSPSAGVSTETAYYRAAEAALENARRRSGKAHARVVGVGVRYYTGETSSWIGQNEWSVTNDGINMAFDQLITRKGTASELLSAAGWDQVVEGQTSDALPGETWRDYIYRIGKVDLPGEYNIVVVAVADGQPAQLTTVIVKKKSANEQITSSNSNYSLAGAEFTVYDKSGKAVAKLTTDANGNAQTANGAGVPSGTYTVKETKAPKGFMASDATWTMVVKPGEKTVIVNA